MGLIRLALILLLVWLVWRLIRTTYQALKPARPSAEQPQKVVRCLHCGVHVPESETITDQGQHFCCKEHHHAWLDHQR